MTSEWPFRPLAEISVNFDTLRKPVKEAERVAGPYPYYGASGIVDAVEGYLFDGEYLLVAEDGENLRTRNTPIAFRATGKFWVNNHAHILQGNELASTRYLEYALLAADITPYLTGAVMPKLTQGNLNKIELPCPPPEIQNEIVGVLGALDDRIENLRQTNATLEAIAAALFKSWFVDFDGVPPEGMQESELGLIPKGWRAGTLADLSELNASKWTDKKHPPTVRYVDLSSVSSNRIEALNEVQFADAPSRARLHLREGDTIVGTVRPGNRAFAYIHAPQANLTGSTGFAVLSPKRAHYASFIYLAATRGEAIERLASLADGAAYPAVRPNVVVATPCVIAPDEVLTEFSSIAQPMLESIGQSSQQAATLAAFRDTLLPRLISGQLRVAQ